MKLSVIIPCYNCSETLEEAIDSVYRQNLSDFEIVLVEDCSTDNTKEVIAEIIKSRPEIKVFYNEKNLGGGATRNIAVSKCANEHIFCLDSDDLLSDGTLEKMLAMVIDKNCDGVGIHKSIKFNGRNTANIARIDTFGYVNEIIPKNSLIEKDNKPTCSLYSTFLFTKQSFNKCGGYPENHGFDTQGFAWRFLLNDLVAYTCENAEYYHRINFHDSYYIREYRQGKTNLNWIKILSEFITLLSENVLDTIINYNINSSESLMDKIRNENKIWSDDNELKSEKFLYYKDLFSAANDKEKRKFTINSIYKTPSYLDTKDGFVTYKTPKSNHLIKRINNKVKKIITNFISKIKGFFYHLKSRDLKINLIYSFLENKFQKTKKIKFDVSDCSEDVIDVVIPTITKDFDNLSIVIENLKLNLGNKINKLYIVSKNDSEIIGFCEENKIHFVDEDSVLGYSKQRINYKVNQANRSGWLFQQLIKLNSDSFVQSENYLVIDSDTVLINKHCFIDKQGKYLFQQSEEWHKPYRKTFESILKKAPKSNLSFVSHMMIFNKKILSELKSEIEEIHNKKWDEVIIDNIDENEMSYFSEFETYGNYIFEKYPSKINIVPFYNKSLHKSHIHDIKNLSENLKSKYNSLSFHDYSN
jgi:glycosyltransferase involved in cell wall biosynthesis